MKDCKHVALISSLYCMIVKNKTILVQNDMLYIKYIREI